MALAHLALLLKVSNDYSFWFTDKLKSKALLKHFIVELKAFSKGGSAHSSPVFSFFGKASVSSCEADESRPRFRG